MARKVGSGTAAPEADACAWMLAALIRRDRVQVDLARRSFAEASRTRRATGAGDNRGFDDTEIESLLQSAVDELALDGAATHAVGAGDMLGDVVVPPRSRSKKPLHFEIKAQLTRPLFKHIQNADWIRGPTDFLSALLRDSGRASALSEARRNLFVRRTRTPGWTLGALWAADVAGATTPAIKARLGVLTPVDLQDFLERKYILHITQEGLRIFRLSDVPAIANTLTSGRVEVDFRPRTARCELPCWTASSAFPKPGAIELTYYVGQWGRPEGGGHHLHEAFFKGAIPAVDLDRVKN